MRFPFSCSKEEMVLCNRRTSRSAASSFDYRFLFNQVMEGEKREGGKREEEKRRLNLLFFKKRGDGNGEQAQNANN